MNLTCNLLSLSIDRAVVVGIMLWFATTAINVPCYPSNNDNLAVEPSQSVEPSPPQMLAEPERKPLFETDEHNPQHFKRNFFRNRDNQQWHQDFRRQPDGQHDKLGPGRGHQLDLTALDLTAVQKEKIQQMRQQTRAKAREIRKQLADKRFAVRRLMFSPDASETEIRTARKQLRELQAELDEVNLNDLLAIRSLLTPEQRRKLPQAMPHKRHDQPEQR